MNHEKDLSLCSWPQPLWPCGLLAGCGTPLPNKAPPSTPASRGSAGRLPTTGSSLAGTVT